MYPLVVAQSRPICSSVWISRITVVLARPVASTTSRTVIDGRSSVSSDRMSSAR